MHDAGEMLDFVSLLYMILYEQDKLLLLIGVAYSL